MITLNEISIVLPAILIGICILLVHIPLGVEVVKRGIIFVDLSIAQLASMGAFLASLMMPHTHNMYLEIAIIQISAFSCAILGGMLFMYIEKNHKDIEETFIGCIFVLSASIILLALSKNPHAGEHLKDILAGQLLFISYTQILISFVALMCVFSFIIKYKEKFFRKYFYIIFALTITITVQMAGIYLVFASLIFPALGTYYIKNYSKKILISYIGGFIGLLLGLGGALYFDLSTGPAIVAGMSLTMMSVFLVYRK